MAAPCEKSCKSRGQIHQLPVTTVRHRRRQSRRGFSSAPPREKTAVTARRNGVEKGRRKTVAKWTSGSGTHVNWI